MRDFRVWSFYWKKYATEAELHMGSTVDAIFEDTDGVPHHENTDIIVEQFIGINDKNDKEIYEGDIVTLDDEGEELDCSLVFFKEGCFRVGDGVENEAGHYLTHWRIIGNIHENPELLEEEE